MLIKKLVVITVTEARLALALSIANTYKHTTEAEIAADLIGGRVWDFSEKKMPQKEVIELYGEWELGKKLAEEHGANQVAIEIGEPHSGFLGDKYDIVYDMNIDEVREQKRLAELAAAEQIQPQNAEVH